MSQQKALFLTKEGGEWEVKDRPIPKPFPGEVLVKIQSAGLNPLEWKIRKFNIFGQEFPAVLGSDAAGIVEQLGWGTEGRFKKGDRVLFQGWAIESNKAAFQQYAIAPADILSKIPPNISYDEAATIPLALATAAVGLYNPTNQTGAGLTPPWLPNGKDKYNNQSIVIIGGSSSVGQFAIQLARLSGFKSIITTASLKHESVLKSLGATHVIDRSLLEQELVDAVESITSGYFADVVYDSISVDDTQRLAVQILKDDGMLVLLRPAMPNLNLGRRNVAQVLGSVHVQRELGISLYKDLESMLEEGHIKPNALEVLPGGLGAIAEGLERVEEGKIGRGKLVIHPWD